MSALRQAAVHLRKAKEFYAAGRDSLAENRFNAATSDAVVSGINSQDVICLMLTGRTGKADDHRQAVTELRSAGQDGRAAAMPLSRLLAVKTKSQYAPELITATDAEKAVDRAATMLVVAERLVAGR